MDGNGAIPAGERADVLLPDSGKMAHPHPRPRSRGGFFPVPVPVRGSGTRRVPRPRNIPDDSRGEGAGRLPREAELGGGLQGGRRPAAREAELCGGRAASDGEGSGAGGQRPVPSDGGRRSWILAVSGGRGLGGGRSVSALCGCAAPAPTGFGVGGGEEVRNWEWDGRPRV